jgi:predicted Zn-dependent protease
MNSMGAYSFDEMKAKIARNTDPKMNQYVMCVVKPLTDVAKEYVKEDHWEIVVFQERSANAFALPGGKVGIHIGLLNVAKNDAQLAAVVGHEIGHVIARHGAERVSQGLAAQGGLTLIDALLSGKSNDKATRGLVLGALGVGLQFGVLLPYGRTQESEADLVGLDLMSKAGFDPRESVNLWKNMSAAGGGQPPEWMSTHPSHENRIASLQAKFPEVLPKFEAAQAAGRKPVCLSP